MLEYFSFWSDDASTTSSLSWSSRTWFVVAVVVAALAVAVPVVATLKVLVAFRLSALLSTMSLRRALEGKHVVVTGASKGLGRELAIIAARAGADVTLIARPRDNRDGMPSEALEEAGRSVYINRGRFDARISIVAVDGEDYAGTVARLAEVYHEVGCPFWVIANAGGSSPGFFSTQLPTQAPSAPSHLQPPPPYHLSGSPATPPDHNHTQQQQQPRWNSPLESTMGQNYLTALTTLQAITHLAKTGTDFRPARPAPATHYDVSGFTPEEQTRMPERIILVGSVLSNMSFLGYAAYSASKYALRGLADGLRSELLPLRTRVHLYLPPNMDTPGHAVENSTKPEITARLDSAGGLLTSEQAARMMFAGVLNERVHISGDDLGELVRVCVGGAVPRPNIISEILALPLIALVLTLWTTMADQEVATYFKDESLKKERKEIRRRSLANPEHDDIDPEPQTQKH